MRSIEIDTFLDDAMNPVRVLKPLPCRELDPLPGPVSSASLVLDLACIFVPARTRALLSGQGGAPGSIEETVVKWAHARVRSLVGTLLSGDVRVVAYRPDAAALTGLGPGLTPTGDDLLVGLAAMSRRLVGGGLVEARAAVAFSTSLAGLPTERRPRRRTVSSRTPPGDSSRPSSPRPSRCSAILTPTRSRSGP